MSTGSTEMGMLEKINQKTKSIKEVFAHDMSKEDKESLQSMLMEAKEEKRQILKSHLYDLKAKYGLKSNDVIVEETTPHLSLQQILNFVKASASIKGPPGEYTKEALIALKKRKRTKDD